MRLFLCDDNPSHRALVKAVLRTEPDLQVVGEGSDAAECIELAPAARPDVLLLDVRMPATDGFQALPRMREVLGDVQIVMLSTAWAPEDEQRALALGATAYVQKPMHILDLPSLLRGAVGQAGALVEQLVRNWQAGERRRAYSAIHHDVEYRPLGADEPLHGRLEMERFFASLPDAERAARVTELRMLEGENQVVLLGRAEIPRGGAVEHLSPAWRMVIRDGKVGAITTYPSWEEAQADAQFSRTGEVREQSLGPGGLWRLMRRRPVAALAPA